MSEAPQGPAFPAAPFFWGSEALGELDAKLTSDGIVIVSAIAGRRAAVAQAGLRTGVECVLNLDRDLAAAGQAT